MRWLRTLLEVLLLLASVPLALWALAALGGPVSDRLDVLTHFAPLALGAALAVLLSALVLARRGVRKRFILVVSGAAALWSFVPMAPELVGATWRDPPAAGSPLKLVTINLWAGNQDVEATTSWLLEVDADVVLMQEVLGHSAEIPRRLRAKYPHGVICSERGCSLAVLSKHPVRRTGLQRRHWAGVDAHAVSAAWAEVVAPGGQFVALTTHYTWPTWVWAQEQQRAELVRLTRAFPRDDLVLTGDFNLTPWSTALREQDGRLGLRRRTRALFSWPTAGPGGPLPFPMLPIDHLYAGAAWRTASVKRGPRLGSDHYPVVVTLVRKGPDQATSRPRRAPRCGRSPAPLPTRGVCA